MGVWENALLYIMQSPFDTFAKVRSSDKTGARHIVPTIVADSV